MSRVSVIALLLLASTFAFAHDLYLVPRGRQVCAGIGETFPRSENAVTADRVEFFRLRQSGKEVPLAGKVAGSQFCASLPPAKAAIVEMAVQPRFIRLDAAKFEEYIHAEGFADVIKSRQQARREKSDGRELYSRYSKLFLGAGGEPFTRPIGHVLELVPQRDPASLHPGESLSFLVLFKGKPLPGVRISAAYAGAAIKGHNFPVSADTSPEGKASLKLDRPGLWYVRLIHMTPAFNDPDIEWRSYFCTLTFTIGK